MEAKTIKLLQPHMVHENKEINVIKIYRSMVLNIEVNDRWSMESCFFLSCKIEMAGRFLLSCKSKWQMTFCGEI